VYRCISWQSTKANPHLHGLLADGLFTKDGTFMPFKEIDQGKLTAKFCEGVLSAFAKREVQKSDQNCGFHL